MTSRYNTTIATSQPQLDQQQPRFLPANHFQEGHPIQVESSEWGQHDNPSTGSINSLRSWTSTSDSPQQGPYNTQAFHAGYAPVHGATPGPLPPRISSTAFSAARNRSHNTVAHQHQQSWQQHLNYNQDGTVPQSPSIYPRPNQQEQNTNAYHGTTTSEGYFGDHHQQQQYRSSPIDTGSSGSRGYQQQDGLLSPQADSPRSRSSPKRREHNAQFPSTIDGELPSLDQYEEMLQKMTSPGLGPTRERTNLRRADHDRDARLERIARHTRKLQQPQQQQTQDQELQLRSEPVILDSDLSSNQDRNALGGQHLPTAEDRKLRRRSSLPSSFGEAPNRALSNRSRRNSGLQHTPSGSLQNQAHAIEVATRLDASIRTIGSRFSWEDENVALREDLIAQNSNPSSLSQVDGQDVTIPDSNGVDQEKGSGQGGADESDRQIEQLQKGLQQLQEGGAPGSSPRSQYPASSKFATSPPSSASRPSQGSPNPLGLPNMQHLLASMDEADMSPPHYRSGTPTSRSRPSTPTTGIRPPLGPAPTTVSGPISSPSNVPRKGSPAGRRVKPGMPLSGSILPQLGSRPRAGSVASVTSMSSITSITMDSALHQAPPTLPLPPPPPMSSPVPTVPTTMGGDAATQRRRKASGSKELVIPSPQLVSESQQGQYQNHGNGQDSLPTPMSPESGEQGSAFPALSLHSPNHPQSQITRLKKRVSLLEKELETLGKELTGRIRNGGELQIKIEQLVVERDSLEKQVGLLHGHVFKNGRDPDAPDLVQALQQVQQDKDVLMKEAIARQDKRSSQGSDDSTGKDDHAATATATAAATAGGGAQLESLRLERDALQESRSVLEREVESMTCRLQHEEAQYRILQDTVQRLTSKLSQLESHHAQEMERLQQGHEEIMEKVVIDHANMLTDLSEQQQSKANDSQLREREMMEVRFQKERQEWVAKEKVLKIRWEEQSARNDALEESLFEKDKTRLAQEQDLQSLQQLNQSLERQLAIERLQQQENAFKASQVDKENQRLRAILADLDLAALLSRDETEDESNSNNNSNNNNNSSSDKQEMMKTIYEIQKQRWRDQMQLMEHKMAKIQEAAADIQQKNIELMVALDLKQSQ
ncbi:hypothetical protein BGX31_000433 [Mortierella sp. GBA43]|nr:hypothetical protein BGX31_000433 [Mortierella sp. GBA43]